MKSTLFLIFSAAVWAQSAPPASVPDLPPDTVIATYGDNQKLTAGELKSFVAAMPPNMQQNALRDRKAFVQQFVMMHRLSEMAEKGKLDQRSPTKESLSFNRMYILMNAQLHEVLEGISIPQTEAQGFYNQSKNRFKQVKVKAIYIRYSSDAADAAKEPKPLTEAEAQIKIAGLRAALLRGEDFVKLVKENSEDQTSAARDGDFGTMRSTDNLPDAIRNGIFALKAGEVSSPVKQPNGFYLFRAEEINAQPFTEVQEEIVNELRQTHFKKWMDDITGGLNLKIQDESFFAGGDAATGK